jgi:hypothetical protein
LIQRRSWFRPATLIARPVDQMLPHSFGQILPSLDLRHQPPKTIRPSSSPSRFAASGSFSFRKRSAKSEELLLFSHLGVHSLLDQFQQHSIFAQLSTFRHVASCFASLGGRLKLW